MIVDLDRVEEENERNLDLSVDHFGGVHALHPTIRKEVFRLARLGQLHEQGGSTDKGADELDHWGTLRERIRERRTEQMAYVSSPTAAYAAALGWVLVQMEDLAIQQSSGGARKKMTETVSFWDRKKKLYEAQHKVYRALENYAVVRQYDTQGDEEERAHLEFSHALEQYVEIASALPAALRRLV